MKKDLKKSRTLRKSCTEETISNIFGLKIENVDSEDKPKINLEAVNEVSSNSDN